MSAQHTPGPWMWTPEQWTEIVRCSRESVAMRQKAASELPARRTVKDQVHWLHADARELHRKARSRERRVLSLLHMWAPECAAIATKGGAS